MTNGYLKNLLAENEEVLFVTRQHWIVLLAEILPEGVLIIALLILIAGRNDYFDIWNYPALLLLSWALNVLLALLAAYLLYQAASKAKAAMLAGLSRQMVQALGTGQDRDVRMKQIQFIIDEVEANEQGAFVPLYQQPVIESSLYGLVALLQYLYSHQ